MQKSRLKTQLNSPRNFQILLIALGLALVPAFEALAQDWKGRGRVQGKVVDEAGEPIRDATVTIVFGERGGPEPTKTLALIHIRRRRP